MGSAPSSSETRPPHTQPRELHSTPQPAPITPASPCGSDCGNCPSPRPPGPECPPDLQGHLPLLLTWVPLQTAILRKAYIRQVPQQLPIPGASPQVNPILLPSQHAHCLKPAPANPIAWPLSVSPAKRQLREREAACPAPGRPRGRRALVSGDHVRTFSCLSKTFGDNQKSLC